MPRPDEFEYLKYLPKENQGAFQLLSSDRDSSGEGSFTDLLRRSEADEARALGEAATRGLDYVQPETASLARRALERRALEPAPIQPPSGLPPFCSGH